MDLVHVEARNRHAGRATPRRQDPSNALEGVTFRISAPCCSFFKGRLRRRRDLFVLYSSVLSCPALSDRIAEKNSSYGREDATSVCRVACGRGRRIACACLCPRPVGVLGQIPDIFVGRRRDMYDTGAHERHWRWTPGQRKCTSRRLQCLARDRARAVSFADPL